MHSNVFENFLADMGERPPGMALDRVDNDGDYCPENCRWASSREQGNNRSNNRVLTFNGQEATLSEWSRRQGIGLTTIRERLRRGWDVPRALTTKVTYEK